MTAIERVIDIAKKEVGYLEKASNAFLWEKTGNAGSGNYTKYWAEIKPDFQGQPWCACFVTWVFVQAFGKEKTEKLLKHYPYVYVPTLANLFTRYANPKVGDIVCFYRNGAFCHTGIVTMAGGDYFETIEGNTSGGSSIIANGGGVCQKSYFNSELPGTKFIRPNYAEVDMSRFKDTKGHYAEKEIDELCDMGIINGRGDGSFAPNEKITRADAALLIRRTIKYITGK